MAVCSTLYADGLFLYLVGIGSSWSTWGLRTLLVNSDTQFGTIIKKVARTDLKVWLHIAEAAA